MTVIYRYIGILLLSIVFSTLILSTQSENSENLKNIYVDEATNVSDNRLNNLSRERVIYRGEPPYLSNLPILDGNLYINHTDSFLYLGGPDIKKIRFSASARNGKKARTEFSEGSIAFFMEEQPYIEFSYQDRFYSLQILRRPYFFTIDLREIPSVFVSLTNRFE